MKRFSVMAGLMLAAGVSGCVVAPAQVAVAPPDVVVPAGVVYVAPRYAVPGPGYYWAHHPRYGWGYRHRYYGWHRGWQ